MSTLINHTNAFTLISDRNHWIEMYQKGLTFYPAFDSERADQVQQQMEEEGNANVWSNALPSIGSDGAYLYATLQTLADEGKLRIMRSTTIYESGQWADEDKYVRGKAVHTIEIKGNSEDYLITLDGGFYNSRDSIAESEPTHREVLDIIRGVKTINHINPFEYRKEISDNLVEISIGIPIEMNLFPLSLEGLPFIPEFQNIDGEELVLPKPSQIIHWSVCIQIDPKNVRDNFSDPNNERRLREMDRCRTIKEELMINRWHPSRVEQLLLAGYSVEDM